MTDLFGGALELQQFCASQGWQNCLIGGIAVMRWSEVRATRDIDLALLTGYGGEEPFIDSLLTRYASRIPDAKDFAKRNRVLLLATSNGIGIDVSLAALPFEEGAIRRASLFEFAPGIELLTCSAEDLMIFKLFASRPLDLRDAEGIAIRHAAELDWSYIEINLRPLAEAKDDSNIMQALASLRNQYLSGS
jgi:hypothetical protein